MHIEDFISKWTHSGGSERANFQSFANELCELLDVPKPDPATQNARTDAYCFERPVTFVHTDSQSRGFIDLYRAGHFVMEAKQGTDAKPNTAQPALMPDLPTATRAGHGKRGTRRWDDTMLRAKNQADGYARAVSRDDGWPPFLMVVDVGHVIEVYADFSGQGQGYTQFPDGRRYRITMDDLRDEKTRDRLRAIWIDPQALDPSKVAARVTREVADRLAALGRSFEGQGHEPETVANFLMRCLFTMFAEDVDLIPHGSFTDLLQKLRGHPEHAAPSLKSLWETMNTGGFSAVLTTDLMRFNGGLFKDADALPLNNVQLSLLIDAAQCDWREVEPAIFGTLLERALDKKQRHKLGAHYTPRAYVERLVVPTIMEPLRADWRDVQLSAVKLAQEGNEAKARDMVRAFHQQLCETRVLDPACGSGNFLYVALELMKRLEGEVTDLLADLGEEQTALALAGHTVDPHQFLGLELNPWAAAVAELVLWIGYLQWHFRTHGKASPSEPVLRDFHNIENRDAVLTYAGTAPRLDDAGAPVTRWDGVTTITHAVTGEQVPDPEARVPVLDYHTPKPATWPEAEFIVGNPPFIGLRNFRKAYSDGYVEALRAAYPNVPENADYVMYWWEKAALAVQAYDRKKAKGTRRFGLITTNSIKQSFNRGVTSRYIDAKKNSISFVYAIPDHPWVDSSDGAAIRIAMTVVAKEPTVGILDEVIKESETGMESEGIGCTLVADTGKIYPDLRLGANLLAAKQLRASSGLASVGYQLTGQGFLLTPEHSSQIIEKEPQSKRVLKPWLGGLGIQRISNEKIAIDVCEFSHDEVRFSFPTVYQHLSDTVLPSRRENARKPVRERWWKYEESRNTFRPAIADIERFIVTSLTASSRVFVFSPANTIADSTTVIFALPKGEHLAILSSRMHTTWCLGNGGTLEDRPRYNKSRCFDPFPFPDLTDPQKTHLRALGDELDAHRKAQQAAHPKLTLTQMYNVLEKLRASEHTGERIEGRDREIYDQGLIGILRDIHDRIDRAVAEAYGWPADLTDDDILHRLVDLNRARAQEEAQGHIRWLRPEYQNPEGHAAEARGKQDAMDLGLKDSAAKPAFPKTLPEQFAAVREALADLGEATPEQIARSFKRGRVQTVQPLLEVLTQMGQARVSQNGRFAM